ncbi:phosphatidate cytidylyltransferase [Niabella yanshanensis]|uniref:Phosphatidate cytidylyltransferase n=1 Tax=Niabella yanshanensis TaxID=577386 RepID=A0ABZ0W0Q4_9BACT|nr:phosphatidate cytidylyltransferase [Niabella yanshanensis]WQD36504.1 phosphatidate cytidylyltransferase [Niabella yanshanensis]
MAFNWSTFWTRAFTALIFVAVMMFGLLFNQWSLFLLISLIYFGCSLEYSCLVEKITGKSIHAHLKSGISLIGYHIILLLGSGSLQLGIYEIRQNFSLPVLIAGFILLVWGIFKTKIISKKVMGWLSGGLLYTALPLGLLLNLSAPQQAAQHVHLGNYMVVFIIGSVWINDTMAYLAGSAIGKTPLSKISPKKTWEGTVSGIILSAGLTWLLFSLIFLKYIEWELAVPGIIISTITAISGTFGDLFESKLKRMAGVKDSGRIMPGHGGFLDRFDSVLFAAPAVWLFIKAFYG